MLNSTLFSIKNFADYDVLKSQKIVSLVIGGEDFSRLGEWSASQLQEIYLDAKKNNISLEIECDILPTQQQFLPFVKRWESLHILPHDNLSIRVQDLGLLDYFYNNNYRIIPLLESGYHNIVAIKKIQEHYGNKIQHFVLSKELVFRKQYHYAANVLCSPIELSLLAPILLFYSPRKLISPILTHSQSPYYQTFAASQESVHKGFVVRENSWGTMFFHPKHMSLISKLHDFHNDQLVKKFIDLRLIDDQSLRLEILNILISLLRADLNSEEFTPLEMQIIQSFPYPVTRGFYDVNKTDVLFPKLKSHHNEHESYHLVGEVLDSIKGEGLIVRILEGQELKLGDQLYLQSPQGNNGIVTLTKLHDLLGHSKVIAHANDLVKMNFMKHFPSQSTVFKIHENLIP